MVAKVRVEGEAFPDRKKQHEEELAAMRSRVSAVIKFVFALLAVFLAVGALLVVFGKNVHTDNPLVRFIFDVDNAIDGPLARDHGVFVFHGHNGHKWDAVVNWGLAAVIYLIIGALLRKLLTSSARLGRSSRAKKD